MLRTPKDRGASQLSDPKKGWGMMQTSAFSLQIKYAQGYQGISGMSLGVTSVYDHEGLLREAAVSMCAEALGKD